MTLLFIQYGNEYLVFGPYLVKLTIANIVSEYQIGKKTKQNKTQGIRMIHRRPIWITANASERNMSETQGFVFLWSLLLFFSFFSFSALLRYNQQRKLQAI